jgi:nitroimidazol reductase NimA-like FMN-containing flavoprotein (pyridoxamine 5'-phosphate oxidase superfamily)
VNETASSEPENASVVAVPHTASEMLELDRGECLRLLAEGTVGRIAVDAPHRPEPVIRPVNYVFDEPSQSVLIRSGPGSKLFALLCAVRAAFEIDGIDPVGRVGWSVIIQGVTEEITNSAELRRIEALGLEPWAPGHKGHWIRIRASTVSGRRIVAVADRAPGYRV